MRLLLTLFILTGTASASSRLFMPVKGLIDKHYLTTSIHKMVASGYTLYSREQLLHLADNPVIPGEGKLLLFQNELADGSRVLSKSIHDNPQGDEVIVTYSEGDFSQENSLVNTDVLLYFLPNVSAEFEITTSYNLKRDGNSLLLSKGLGDKEVNLIYEQSKDYRIYRGQRDSETMIITETITINGYNPYVVFRHITWNVKGSNLWSEELSVGTYLDKKGDEIGSWVIENYKGIGGLDTARTGYSRISYNFDGNILTDEGEQIELTLIKDSEIWLEVKDRTGDGNLSSLLVEQLRAEGNDKAAKIASQLHEEGGKNAVFVAKLIP